MTRPGGYKNGDYFDHMGESEAVTLADGANTASSVNMDVELTNLTVAAGENATITVAATAGMFPGQIKRFVASSIGAAGDIAISGIVSNIGAAEVHTLDANAEFVDVIYTGARLVRLASTATIS